MKNYSLNCLQFDEEYRTGSQSDPLNLIKDGLSQSTLYRRASGYFSSSIFDLCDSETLQFAKSGGQINIMCSPVLSEEDLHQISLGYEIRKNASETLTQDLKIITSSKKYENRISFIATLIQKSILDIKLLFRRDGNGIFHEKTGYFKDNSGNLVSFSGSANDSRNAFSGTGNFERIKVFCSWKESDHQRSQSDASFIDDLWNNNVDGLEVYDFPEIAKEHLLQFARDDLNFFNEVFKPPLKSLKSGKTLMKHQVEALDNWRFAGKRGILKHATGSGKTITAIGAIKEHINNGHPCLVLVPSKLLLKQWYQEITQEIDNTVILRCGAGHTYWKKSNNLKQMLRSSTVNENGGIVLAVNDTASSSTFLAQMTNIENILLIADEVHSLGSSKNSKIMNINYQYRLGLSATPERYRDEQGTDQLIKFFGSILTPEVTLADALKNGRLVPFDYYPLVTYLTAAEEQKWLTITKKIINYLRRNELELVKAHKDPILSNLLISRARVAKKAYSKIETVTNTITEQYQVGQHWLVYCEDQNQLNEINNQLTTKQINPFIYVSNMSGSASGELEAFSKNGGVLLSIRCLDEGVDIPKISHAVIAASSQNPRQFIQRRGRVLRSTEGKTSAVIYDCIVGPVGNTNTSSFDGLITAEITRAMEFSKTARNGIGAESTLRNLLISLGSDPDNLLAILDGDHEDEN